MVSGGAVFGRYSGHEGAALVNGVSVPLKGTPENLLPLPPGEGDREKSAMCSWARGSHQEPPYWPPEP